MLRSSLFNALALFDRDICNIARRAIEQNVDFLKGQALGLWQAEVDERDRERDHAGKNKVRSVAIA
jgi:hypothetical protein